VQLINAEESFKDSCRKYKDLYLPVRSRNDIFDVDATLRYGDEIDRDMCLWGIVDEGR